MNPELLANILKTTYHAEEKAVRAAAEAELKKLEGKAGFVATLLKIITVPQIDLEVRQSASILLKNMVTQYWSIRKGPLDKISVLDRKVVKENLVEAIIVQLQQKIRVQLLDCLYKIVRLDYPDDWPGLLDVLMKNIQIPEKSRVYGAICCLRMIFKKNQYKNGREEMNELVRRVFPIELKLFQTVVRDISQGNPIESFEMMRILIKTFYLATSFALPPYIRDFDNLKAWLELLIGVFNTPLPKEHTPSDPEQLKQHPFLKCKKWCSVIFNGLFLRFGHPSVVEKDDVDWAKHFYATWAEKLLASCMQMLKFRATGNPMTPRVLNNCFQYLNTCVNYAALYKCMKPHLDFIILKSILPTLCLDKEDLSLWQRDAIEFVRREADINNEFFDPRVSAQNLLIELVKLRTRDCLTFVLNAVGQIFNGYASAAPEKRNPILKEGAMRMFGCLKKLLAQKKDFNPQIENILVNHIFGEFKSPNGFMRARANWLVGTYNRLQYSKPENHAFAVKAVVASLEDKEIPVKLAAAVALSRIVRQEKVVEFIRPLVPAIINHYFLLVDSIGNDVVVATLGNLIHILGDDVAPFAVKIIAKLTSMFGQLSQADDEDDVSAMTATQCLGTINVILYALENKKDMYPIVEKLVEPLIAKMICVEGIEWFEDILEMMTCFTFYPNEISPFMWACLPRIIAAYNDWAGDYISNMVPPIDNFISKGTDRFLATKEPNLLHEVLGICKRRYDDPDENSEMDAQHAAKILETLVAHCGGKIDNYIPDIVAMVGKKIIEAKTLPLKLLSIDVIAGCAHYNPLIFSVVCTKGGKEFTTALFNTWLSHVSIMKGSRKHQKMSVLGFSSLARLPINKLPQPLGQGFHQVLTAIQELLSQIKMDAAKRAQAGDDEDDDESDDESEEEQEDFEDLPEDDDAKQDVGALKGWREQVQRALQEEEGAGAEVFASPYDQMDEYVFAAECLTALKRNEPVYQQKWASSLNAQQKAALEANFLEAKERQEQKAKMKEEGKGKAKKKKP